MDKESGNMSLIDLYDEGSEVVTWMETSIKVLYSESLKWNPVLHSHISKVLQSERCLKLETFGAGLDWLNTTKPLTLDEDLKDRIIVLDFFTYCCINCEHALPFLREAEVKFKKNPGFVIIGVHSPKFPNEKSLESVKNAVLRYNIKHPVINDPENSLWNKFGVYCWPTVLILSPDHRVLFSLVGETQINKLSYLCELTITYFKLCSNINLNQNQLCINLPDEYCPIDTLLYPSGISTKGSFVMVSDTGNNRLLLLSIDGEVLDIIGSGISGHSNGSFASSSFNHPHGTVWNGMQFVFVADTGNHSIRMIDLKSKSVYTIFDAHLLDTKSKENEVQSFASPWDVCLGPELGSLDPELNVLYIAVAGSHQIWTLKLEPHIIDSRQFHYLECTPFAGNGKEECRNNTYKMKAGFAQPSGICYLKLFNTIDHLFIADSESSTVRSISLRNGAVKTIVGGGLDPKDLFQFGDNDGFGYETKLQHPIGICEMDEMDQGLIYITDTYNHKLKLINVRTGECLTVAGSRTKATNSKTSILESEFCEPSGICYSPLKGGFFVADTNNHCIKFFDPKTKVTKFLSLKFPNSTCIDGPTNSIHEVSSHSVDSKHTISLKDTNCIKINLVRGGNISCSFKLSQGMDLTETNKPYLLTLKIPCFSGMSWTVLCQSGHLFDSSKQPYLILQCNEKEKCNCEVEILYDCVLCDNINNVCLPKKFLMKLEIELSHSGLNSYDAVFIL